MKDVDFNMSQHLVQEQKLHITQEVKMSLELLQMPIVVLQETVEKELQENPLLDQASETSENLDDYHSQNDNLDYRELIKQNRESGYDYTSYSREEDNDFDPLNIVEVKKTFKDYLREQILGLEEDREVIDICEYIVENIDDRGYLRCSNEEIQEEKKADKEQVENAVKIVQDFHPWGVAARELKECLKIQLNKKGLLDETVCKIVDKSLELIADNKIKEISREFNLSMAKAQEYCNIIRILEPKPSRGFYTGEPEKYVLPEAYIRRIGDDFYIIMNDRSIPGLVINDTYKSIITENKNEEAVEYVKEKLNKALYLMKGIENRKRTIYRILETILKLQRDYFMKGGSQLKPMTIAAVAKEVVLHESTVSRAIRDKFIGTDFGIVRIKDLFTTAISSDIINEDMSSAVVKKEIKKLIDSEDRSRPMSDQDISEKLQDMNINISRRTVAKYREGMGIGASSKRKVFE
ncbi:MAG: RNA polymerase factor sigma-54 [Bacillota bacterium]|nr:RNA polymerase factor sigma-54 [Bacillota bacterium]